MGRVGNDCAIYVKFGGRKVRIPVNPEELEIQYPTDHKTYNVLDKGEIVVPRKPSLRIVSWESFFPANGKEPYVNSGAESPENYEEYLSEALEEKTVCRLIISRSGLYDTNMRCIVSDFKTTDKGGEPGDVYYSVEFTEYRDYSPRTVSVIVQNDAAAGPAQAAEVSEEETRPVETPVMRVGATVVANGKYWYDSYGSKPYGTANNLTETVTRIASGRPYPIHIGSRGWMQESQLQIVG